MGLLKLHSANQLDLETENERVDEVDFEHEMFDEFFKAVRRAVRALGGYEECAVALERIWGSKGRHVTEALLRSTLSEDVEAKRNYFRFEWSLWFALHSEDVREVFAVVSGRGKPTKKPEDELRDLKQELRDQFPKQAEKLIRKAATP